MSYNFNEHKSTQQILRCEYTADGSEFNVKYTRCRI